MPEPKAQAFRFPAVILIDSREKYPYSFKGFRADNADGCKYPGACPLEITTRVATLPTGDYSLFNMYDRVAIERKSLEDLYATVSQHRERFVDELGRLAKMEFAAVVIEASYTRILTQPPPRCQLQPKALMRSILSWMQRYGVHFLPCEDRRMAETFTFRMLQKFYLRDKENATANGLEGNHQANP